MSCTRIELSSPCSFIIMTPIASSHRAILDDHMCRFEEDLEPAVGHACVAKPGKLLWVEYRILKRVNEEFDVLEYVGLGGFGNARNVYE